MLPTINTDICTRCGLCNDDCVAGAIDSQTMMINAKSCMGCGHCIAICPVAAPSLVDPSSASLPQGGSNAFASLVQLRRSVRRYRPEPISEQHLAALLDTVRFAPTGTNSQGMAVTVLASASKVQEAVGLALAFYQRLATIALNPLTRPVLRLVMGKTRLHKLLGYRHHLQEALDQHQERDILAHNAPALFIFHAGKSSSTPAEDAVIWATTASLHAESLGIGTCYNGFLTRGINGSAKLRQFLKIPAGNKVYCCFTAGYPRVNYARPAPRPAVNVQLIR